MEEFNLLLGWLFRASNWLPDFAPQLEEDRFGGHCGVAECRAVRPYSRRLFRTSEDGQGKGLSYPLKCGTRPELGRYSYGSVTLCVRYGVETPC